MGPGPSDVDPRVLKALSTPLVGHLDPEFAALMDETQELLRYVFQTENRLTLAISGTGSAGMETVVVNLIEPGDRMLVCINGVFGARMKDVAERAAPSSRQSSGRMARCSIPTRSEQPSSAIVPRSSASCTPRRRPVPGNPSTRSPRSPTTLVP